MPLAHEVVKRVSTIIDPVYLVGGSVRDTLMDRPCSDFDFSTPLSPDSIEQAIRAAGRRPYLMGKRYGTVAFRLDALTVEVTTFRSESYTEGSRRPSIEFLADVEQDLGRRDFTINAMALHGDDLIDLFDGRADLAAGLVRAVGNPAERFAEDPLRMLRAARFVSELDFHIDAHTRDAARELARSILIVARERWMIELDRLLVGPGVAQALALLSDTGLLRFLLPELALQVNLQVSDGAQSLFDQTTGAVCSAPCDVTSRWAALLRDVGAPYAAAELAVRASAGRDALRDTALIGAEIVERTALYLKWSNRRREDVKWLVANTGADGV
jgi:tRNA nucleotidyltransferase/poly(A) polymerase